MLTPTLPRSIKLTSLAIFLLFGLSSTVAAQSVAVSVPGTAKWIDTKVDVVEGDLLAITATGLWTEGDTTNGPDGIEKPWPDNFFNFADLGVCMYCAQTATPFQAALIGYIGSSPPAAGSYTSKAVFREATKIFYVGSNYQAEAPASGRLWLNKNTDAYSNYTVDNGGQVQATITVSPPETEAQYHQRAQAAAASINALEPLEKATNFCVRGTLDHIQDSLVKEALMSGLREDEKIVLSSAFLLGTLYQDQVRIDYEESNGQYANAWWDRGRMLFAGVDTSVGLLADHISKTWWEKLGLKAVKIIGTRSVFDCAMAGLWYSGELGGQIGRLLREKLQPPSTADASIAGAWTLVRSTATTCINFDYCRATPIHILVDPCTATECTISRSDGDWQRAHTITRTVTSTGPAWLAEFDDIGVECHGNLNVARIGLRFSVTTAEGNQAKSVGGFYTVRAASNPPDCTGNASASWTLTGSH